MNQCWFIDKFRGNLSRNERRFCKTIRLKMPIAKSGDMAQIRHQSRIGVNFSFWKFNSICSCVTEDIERWEGGHHPEFISVTSFDDTSCEDPCSWLFYGGYPVTPIKQNMINTWQDGCHFRRRHFQMHFFNENVWISLRISLKFVPEVQINSIQTMKQIMAWCRLGAKPLSDPMVVSLLTHICVTWPQWAKQNMIKEDSGAQG